MDAQWETSLQQVSEYHPWIYLSWIFWATWGSESEFRHGPAGLGLHTDTTSISAISTSSTLSSVVVLSFLSDFAIIFQKRAARLDSVCE